MSDHQASAGSDMGAAFVGVVGGALLIGAILYGIVLLTNAHFAKEKAESGGKKAAAVGFVGNWA